MIGFRLTVPFPYTTACYTINNRLWQELWKTPTTHVAYRGGMATKEKIENNKRLKLMEISESF